MKVLVAFDTKYGNTKKVGELIAEGIRTGENNEVLIESVKHIDLNLVKIAYGFGRMYLL